MNLFIFVSQRIGMGIALRLAQAQASVTIVGRNKEKGLHIVEQMKQLSLSSTATAVAHTEETSDTCTPVLLYAM
jgi:NAD(P)-dependent dehydrogenase (short-subunit alcohol dehydrogenase family)